MSLKKVYLSLGSNIGEREENLRRAIEALAREHIHIVAESSIYETEPQDVPGQRWFLNMVVECETTYFPIQLLSVIQRIEREFGRVRNSATVRRGPRSIDIDLLLFGSVVMSTAQLTIPHARMFDRRFVLEPLLEIAPGLRHPVTGEAVSKFAGKVAAQRLRKIL